MHRLFDEESESVERKSSTCSGGNTNLDRDESEGQGGAGIKGVVEDAIMWHYATAFNFIWFCHSQMTGPHLSRRRAQHP
jgi:hypothetical protein